MPNTLGDMKTRLREELGNRADLETAIGNAIRDAIEAYEHRNWFFSQSRECVFPTIADQVYYGPEDPGAEMLAYLERIHWMNVYIGTQAFPVTREDPETFEYLIQSGAMKGEPSSFVYFGERLGLYPAPLSPWQLRIGGIFRPAPPLTDGETGNPWMTVGKGEKIIRLRAKYELFLHRLRNIPMAEAMTDPLEEAISNLEWKTANRAGGYPQTVESAQS